MRKLKRIGYDEPVELTLRVKDRALLVDHTLISPDLLMRLERASASANQLQLRLTLDDLGEMIDAVAAAANHASDLKRQRALDRVCAKLQSAMESYSEEPPTT